MTDNGILKESVNGGLARGWPCDHALERASKLLANAHAEMLSQDFDKILSVLQYGDQEGNEEPRAAISKFLSEEYGELVSTSDLFLSGGSSSSLFFLGKVIVPKGCKFLVEEVSYLFGISTIKEDLNREMLPVKFSPDGLDLQHLENILKVEYDSCPPEQEFSCAFYLMPTYHNPKCVSYSSDNSRSIVNLAAKYKALLICDDVYNLLYFEDEEKPRRLRSYANECGAGDYVVSLGSFSKICAPGLRLGWIECSPNVFNAMGNLQTLQSGCNFSHYQSYMMMKAIENGSMTAHVKVLRQMYRERAQYVIQHLIPHLPSGSTYSTPKGGFYIWVELPLKYNSTRLWEISMEKFDLPFHKGERFSTVGRHSNCLRLTYSALPMKQLEVAVSQFVSALSIYLEEADSQKP